MKRPIISPLTSDFLKHWSMWYADVPPVGFLLRGAYQERWLRVHALPQAKRYPTSGRDYAEVIRRFNIVAEDVLGAESVCALIVLRPCDATADPRFDDSGICSSRLSELGPLPEILWDEEEGIFVSPMCLFGNETVWQRGHFDGLFSLIAQDYIKALLVECNQGRVVAPYDGGIDIIFANSFERDQAEIKYQVWLSPREDGL